MSYELEGLRAGNKFTFAKLETIYKACVDEYCRLVCARNLNEARRHTTEINAMRNLKFESSDELARNIIQVCTKINNVKKQKDSRGPIVGKLADELRAALQSAEIVELP